MSEHRCEECKKSFDSESALNQHNQAKHSKNREMGKKKIRLGKFVPVIILVLIIIGAVYLITRPGYELKIRPTDHVKGSGQIEIIEFSDFECPACGAAYPIVKKFMDQYSDKVKLAYRHFPLPYHKSAPKAAEASECAAEQGKFWEYHDKLFDNQGFLGLDSLKRYANETGLNTTQFNSCLDSGKMASKVSDGVVEGKNLNLGGTPSFFVNGQKLVLSNMAELETRLKEASKV